MTNTSALAKHDQAIQTFLIARYDFDRHHIGTEELREATVAYQRACREFEREYRVEDAK